MLFSVRLSSKYFQIYIMEKTSYQILLNLRLEIYRIIHYLPTNDYNEKKHGDIVSRIMDDGNKIKEAIYLNFESLIPNTLTILGVTGYLFYLNTELAMLSFFGAPLFVFTLSYFSKRLRKVSAHLQQSIGDITQMIQESLTNMKIIHIYTAEEQNIAKFNRIQNRNKDSYIRQIKLNITREQIDAYVQFLIFLLIIWYGGVKVLNGTLTSPELMSFFTGIILLVEPIVLLSSVYAKTYQSTASIERINDFLLSNLYKHHQHHQHHQHQSLILLNLKVFAFLTLILNFFL